MAFDADLFFPFLLTSSTAIFGQKKNAAFHRMSSGAADVDGVLPDNGTRPINILFNR